jgi:pyruvate kinase
MVSSLEPLWPGQRTKIVATVGPASESVERLESMVRAGADVFRLNMAHGTAEWRESVIRRIREISRLLGKPIGILVDLSGPKIRLGPIAGGAIECQAGAEFRFVSSSVGEGDPTTLTSTYPSLVGELKRGDLVLLSDGTVTMRVFETGSDWVLCRVEQPGEIRSGSGINLPGVELQVSALTDKDRLDVQWAARVGVDFVGLSFVQRAADIRQLRQQLDELNCPAWIVAKIEKPQAVVALDEIIQVSDAVMVARGDLGVEIDVARVPAVQKRIIARCQQAQVPVITATQMLESMRSNRMPTRAEATDVANAILDGSDAVMLSAETAMGQYPVESVGMMNRIARETESLVRPQFDGRSAEGSSSGELDLTESLVAAAGRLGDQVAAKLIIVATESGRTARILCKQRGQTGVTAISDDEGTVRRMTLLWGVIPLLAHRFQENTELVNHVEPWAIANRLVRAGDRVVFIANTNWTGTGHDMLVVHEIGKSG